MWTPSSALQLDMVSLFKYLKLNIYFKKGNIVPMTNQGRIACIIFALFGAPLAIMLVN